MSIFNILPGYVRTPPGLERVILRRMPRAFAIGTVALGLPSLTVRLAQWIAGGDEWAVLVSAIDICALSVFFLYWQICLFLTLSAFIVMVMKGPAYVADAYPLQDAETPGRPGPDD
ncbi:hypothetical protein CR155_12150 [Pollutimonas nitritireducens]|uniref:Uncharacterized protein n=1 Tax=Pollutimonas nitritireducens TaxID=2045209 RepID=A0A2N4UEX6_9BURK|nr:hypothetical protein [Pollutimonas nitritireducens]PLC53573.1 hypothetical protein CR155_12150 [Pollutimonas nitritireducens]